ncbi:uncharacterized protein [Palaemon carinicauda]|uniref:uncharacterized protein n=1 Tax=Palaemon carinicauda TaxID=392227 RepID=UPI0035B68C6B
MEKLAQSWLMIKIMSLVVLSSYTNSIDEEEPSYSYDLNEVIQLTSDRRFAFPVGTLISFTPSISMPINKDLPEGFSNIASLSLPFIINCDDLGMTSEENTWGRKKQDIAAQSVGNLAGGDREVLYKTVEHNLNTVGINGKACMLRAICEMFVEPLEHHGLIGEFIEVFFSPSRKHENDERLSEYTKAELEGKSTGRCEQYHEACPYSFFVSGSRNETLALDTRPSYSYDPNEVIQLTSDRRLAFPVGTIIYFILTISIPIDEDLPDGLSNKALLSLPFPINCDDLGMTSEENTWGREKRDTAAPSVGNLAGGDREVLYKIVENNLNTVGINGKACMLRAICEMFVEPLEHHGLIGEFIEVFFSPSRKHENDERLSEYTKAELEGKSTQRCEKYHEACPYSFFVSGSRNETLALDTRPSYSYDPNEVIQLTSDRRLAFPVGTDIYFVPTISMPIDADLPVGFSNDAILSLPFIINCDDLGMTSEENTWGRKKRDTAAPSVGNLAGGDREVLYKIVEHNLNTVGINGKACMLRAICEMFVEPLEHHGLTGEFIEVFFSPSRKHENDERLSEYTKAELEGKSTQRCEKYHEACPYSFFVSGSRNETLALDTPPSYSYDPNEVIQLTSNRRLAFPVGTHIDFGLTIFIPIDKDLPVGFSNGASLSNIFLINCDDLGMTSEENTWGRKKQDIAAQSVGNLAGGDREVLYKIVEHNLNTVGINGKACMLRAICEMFVEPLEHYGLIGELIEIFLSPSRKHENDERLSEYTKAELEGKSTQRCEKYHKACPYSFFVSGSRNETLALHTP